MIGKTLGAYKIDAELGAGGMGMVYAATVEGRAPGIEAGSRVALKIVHPHLLEQPGFFKRFLREADVGKSVRHDNLVRTFDVDALLLDGKQMNFLVMEFVEGQTLRQLLDELGKVPEELCRHIAKEMAKALGAIHAAGIVHRDLKPDNALITKDEQVKIMDLGVARLADEVIRLSQTGAFVGSVLYAAPEQFKGGDGIDGRADLYALGLTLYELTTGRHPFADEDLRVAIRKQMTETPRPVAEMNPQISAFFEEVVTTLITKDPDGRFANAGELLAVLEEGDESEWWHTRARAIRAETKQPLRRIRIPRETALYGRDDELARLHEAYDRVKQGEGQVVLVQGEAGIGKTRLVDEFVGKLRQEGEDLNFVFGGYPPGGAATASGAFSTAYREQLGSEDLEQTLKRYLTETPLLIPAFAALLRGDATPAGSEPLTKDSIQTVFVHATRALGEERPTVVLIEDLHYSPQEGRALFAAMAAALSSSRVLLVGTARREIPEEWTSSLERQDQVTRMQLDRLRPKDVGALLLDIFRSERLADELGFQVLTKSDGNPFFVFEIVRGLREGKFITKSDTGGWVKTGMIKDIKIPSSVLDLIEARIQDLDEEEKDLLEVAACAGFEFDPSLVAEALALGVLPALKQFARIEKKHRLIRSSGRRYVFDHHQVQEALYKGVFEQIREHYHAALGDALEKRSSAATVDAADVEGPVSLELCDHFLAAQRDAQALRYLDGAVKHLADGYLHETVVHLAHRALARSPALQGPDRVGLLLTKAHHLGEVGRRAEQGEALDETLTLANAVGSPALGAQVRSALGMYEQFIGGPDAGSRWLSESLEMARAAGDRERELTALDGLGGAYWRLGQFEEARNMWESALEAARSLGKTDREESSAANLALALWDLGRTAEAREHMERFLQRSEGSGTYLANLGELHALLGDQARARKRLERALTVLRERGNRVYEISARHELGDLEEQAGNLDAAEAQYEHALTLAREVSNRYERSEVAVLLGRLRLNRKQYEQARESLEEGKAVSREIGRRDCEALAAAYEALLPGGDASEAEELCAANEEHIGKFECVELRFVLWKATGKREHLAEAHSRLMFLRDHAPEDCKTSILENVPLHAEIVAAWAEHGGADAG